MTSRRDFLKSAALVPAIANPVTPGGVTAAIRDSSLDPWIEVDAAMLRRNVAEIARRAGGRPVLAVIKNNGYGLGVANVARVFERLDQIAAVAVVKLHEAITLRDAGIVKPILLLGPFDTSELRDIVERKIMYVVPAVDRRGNPSW